MEPFVPKHGPRPAMVTPVCRYSPTGHQENDCAATAAWHVMWDGDRDHSFTCETHMDLIRRRWMYDDRHPVSPDCGMPGALWLYTEQRCGFPDESDRTDVATLAATLLAAGTETP